MTKVSFYVDLTVGNVKRTEIGAETLQSVKVIKAMSIISFYTFANSFKWQLNFVIYKKMCNCEIVVFYAIIFVRPSVRTSLCSSVCPSVRQSVRSSLSTFPNFRWAVKLFIRCFSYTHSVQRYFYFPLFEVTDCSAFRSKFSAAYECILNAHRSYCICSK